MALTALMLVGTYFASHGEPPPRAAFDAGTVALLVVAGSALTARRRHPVATLAGGVWRRSALPAIGYTQGAIWLALIVAYISAVLAGKQLVAAAFAVAGFLLFPSIDAVLGHADTPSLVGSPVSLRGSSSSSASRRRIAQELSPSATSFEPNGAVRI